MLVWTIAIVFAVLAGLVGYYVGAFKMAFTTLALLLTLFFLKPLGALLAKVFPLVGLDHPVALAILGPLLLFILMQVIAKSCSVGIGRVVGNFYKYKASDTQRMLFDRFNQRVGPCLGVLNGFLYFLLLAVAAAGLGYATIQLSRSPETDSFWMKAINPLARGLQAARFTPVVGPFIPAPRSYFDAADILGDWFHQPLIQKDLAAYPALITLSDRKEFQTIGNDPKVQQFLIEGHTISEIASHPQIWPVLANKDLAIQATELLKDDLTDLKAYLGTGKSQIFADEPVLGRWDFDLVATVAENKKLRRLSGLEVNKMRFIFTAQIDGAVMLAIPENKLIVRRPQSGGTWTRREGSWKGLGGGKYAITFPVADDKNVEMEATIADRRLQSVLAAYQVVFSK